MSSSSLMIVASQWLGCFFSVVGSLLLASRTQWSAYGWLVAIVGNLAWIAFGWIGNAQSVLFQSLSFALINAIGAYRWLSTASSSYDRRSSAEQVVELQK